MPSTGGSPSTILGIITANGFLSRKQASDLRIETCSANIDDKKPTVFIIEDQNPVKHPPPTRDVN
ncbi:hypothetical protein DID76_03605 [Candidatus Marinamargulisbacteria bacterium SCGC AG-414-C22]|nr:hypothetical protein DID76_03605 [Candidatus Marinamargulisbacteria bacterium SCGC AG-414-C22]